MADKVVYLIDRDAYRKELVERLTHKDLEEWVAEEDYTGNYTIVKIEANGYSSVDEALEEEMGYIGNKVSDFEKDYYVITFGF